MRALRFLLLAAVLAALLILPAANRTVQSVAQQQADQANVAATTDATYTSGSVDLEGVPENDTTTFFFTRKEEEAAATNDTIPARHKSSRPDRVRNRPLLKLRHLASTTLPTVSSSKAIRKTRGGDIPGR